MYVFIYVFLCMQECEDFETVSDFEVLVKSSHGGGGLMGGEKDEFNNHKDHNQEKPSKFKQRYPIHLSFHHSHIIGL